jgi:uncharacterized protein (DUF2225 family)
MASLALYPILSEDGWLSSSSRVGDQLFSTFFCSDYSQSYIYAGSVASLAWIIQQHQDSIPNTVNEVQRILSKYFSRYFNNVVVECTDMTDPASPSKAIISIYVKYTDTDGVDLVLGRLVEYTDTIINSIVTLNNG